MASLEVRAALRGDLTAWAKQQYKATSSAVASVMRRRTTNLKNGIRRQVASARLGKLGLAVRGELKSAAGQDITRRGDAIDCTGRVWSKAIKKRPGGLVDLITVFDQGATVTAHGDKWLPIRNPDVVKSATATPQHFPGRLTFVRLRPDLGALILKHQTRGMRLINREAPAVVAFWCVKRATLKKRLNTARAYRAATKGLDELVAREVERRVSRAAGRFF